MKVVVVGVDGSRQSLAALRYALELARDGNVAIRVVTAWHVPSLAYGSGLLSDGVADGLEAAAEETQKGALEAVDTHGVTVQRRVREGDAGHVLAAESEDADLLVVGSRGHGGLGDLVLGSASHYCCRRAHCPVVVIPHAAVVAF